MDTVVQLFTAEGQEIHSYSTNIIPRIGEIVMVQHKADYKVRRVEHRVHRTNGLMGIALYCELA